MVGSNFKCVLTDRLAFWPPLSFPIRHILDSSKLREYADDNFKFDENGRKFSKQIKTPC